MINLSTRERELLKLVAQGLAPSEITKRMQLSPRTIEFFIVQIDQKAENAGFNLAELLEEFV